MLPRRELASAGAFAPLRGLDELLKFGRPKLGGLILGAAMAPMELCRNEGDGSPVGVKEGAEEGGGGGTVAVEWSPEKENSGRCFLSGVAGELESGKRYDMVIGRMDTYAARLRRGEEDGQGPTGWVSDYAGSAYRHQRREKPGRRN